MSKSTKKPTDLWFFLGGAAMTIAFFLIPKTPVVIVFCLVAIFALLIHPLWNFWWIEESKIRQIILTMIFIILLSMWGYSMRPSYPQTWIVTEGEQREFIGTWIVPLAGKPFDCTLSTKGNKKDIVISKCIVADSEEFIAVTRYDSSNKDNCIYWGIRTKHAIEGEYYCGLQTGITITTPGRMVPRVSVRNYKWTAEFIAR